jgi:hypothetical protein
MHWIHVRTRSRVAIAVTASCLATALSACGDDPGPLPGPCGEGDQALLRALRSAPGPVRLGHARLSDCLQRGASGDQLQLVGTGFVEAASRLSARARQKPEGQAAVELGYLVAAAHRGGAHTQGVHDELLRRLDQEANSIDTGSRAYRRGARAGQTAG